MKETEVIDLLTACATNERIDKLISQNAEYVAAGKKTLVSLEELNKLGLSKEAQNTLDKYDAAQHEEQALYAKFAYQQGLKDMYNLMFSLHNSGEAIEE